MRPTLKNLMIYKDFYALGTLNEIRIFNWNDESILDEAVRRVIEIDSKMSVFNPGSEVSKLNGGAGRRFTELGPDTFSLLQKAKNYGKISGGAFDITIRPLVELWGIGKKGDFIPEDGDIAPVKQKVDFHDILLNPHNRCAALKNAGQSVDLGGIAKGYAADEVKRILLAGGVESAVINLGGNVLLIGNHPEDRPFYIGIQNPFAPTGRFIGLLSASSKTVVTSGSNERFFIKDSVRYHHILDPRTGAPAQSGVLSVTVVSSESADADALSTALFILGPKNSGRLLKMCDAQAVFIMENFDVIVTNGLKDHFKLIQPERIQ